MLNFLTLYYNPITIRITAVVNGIVYTTIISRRFNNKFFLLNISNFFLFNNLKLRNIDIIIYNIFITNVFEKNSIDMVLYGLSLKSSTPYVCLDNLLFFLFCKNLDFKKSNSISIKFFSYLKFKFYVFCFKKILVIKIMCNKKYKLYYTDSIKFNNCFFFYFVVSKLKFFL